MKLSNHVGNFFCYVLPLTLAGTVGTPLNTLAQYYTPGSATEAPRLVTGGVKFASCAAMQEHFNSLKWDVEDTRFAGFEKRKKRNIDGWGDAYVTDEACLQGYQIQESALGKLICAGNIVRRGGWKNDPSSKYEFQYANSNKRDSCRYRD